MTVRKRFKTVEADDTPLVPVVDAPKVTPGITREFLLAGRAYFVAENNKGEQFSYKVHRREFNLSEGFYVRVACQSGGRGLLGAHGSRGLSYQYVGTLNADTGALKVVGRSNFIQGTPEFDVAKWALEMVFNERDIPEGYRINHIGKCGKCGRSLVDGLSSTTGLHTEEEDCP